MRREIDPFVVDWLDAQINCINLSKSQAHILNTSGPTKLNDWNDYASNGFHAIAKETTTKSSRKNVCVHLTYNCAAWILRNFATANKPFDFRWNGRNSSTERYNWTVHCNDWNGFLNKCWNCFTHNFFGFFNCDFARRWTASIFWCNHACVETGINCQWI